MIGVKGKEAPQQLSESLIRSRFDLAPGGAEKCRQIMCLQGQPGDNAPASATAAFEGPEEIRIGAFIGNAQPSIRGDDFRFQKTRSGRAKAFRETAKAAALDQSRNAH